MPEERIGDDEPRRAAPRIGPAHQVAAAAGHLRRHSSSQYHRGVPRCRRSWQRASWRSQRDRVGMSLGTLNMSHRATSSAQSSTPPSGHGLSRGPRWRCLLVRLGGMFAAPRGASERVPRACPWGSTGSLLIISLWLILILAAAAAALGNYLSTESRLMRYQIARTQARAWATSGVYLALQRLADDAVQDGYDWLGDDWAYFPPSDPSADPTQWIIPMPVGDPGSSTFTGTLTITMTDQDRWIDLNAADEATLTRWLSTADVVGAVRDYRDNEQPAQGDYERDDVATPPYTAKNDVINTLEELWDIPWIASAPDAQSTITREGTVHGDGTININTVGSHVLQALVTPDYAVLAEDFVNRRDSQLSTGSGCKATSKTSAITDLAGCTQLPPTGQGSVESLLGAVGINAYDVTSSVFQIVIMSRIDKPALTYRVEAMVKRGGTTPPSFKFGDQPNQQFQILSWKES